MSAAILGLLLVLAGCTTTLREIQVQAPSLTREAMGTPDEILECTQNYAEDHFGGAVGRLGLLSYETRSDGATRLLVGCTVRQPANVFFTLAVTPLTADRVVVRLRVQSDPLSLGKSAVVEAVDACVPPERDVLKPEAGGK